MKNQVTQTAQSFLTKCYSPNLVKKQPDEITKMLSETAGVTVDGQIINAKDYVSNQSLPENAAVTLNVADAKQVGDSTYEVNVFGYYMQENTDTLNNAAAFEAVVTVVFDSEKGYLIQNTNINNNI